VRRYTPRQQAEFKARFIQKQRYRVAILVPPFGALGLLLMSRRIPDFWDQATTIILGILGLFLSAAVFTWLNWRCPACKRYLGRALSPRQCPKCKVELASR